MTTSPTLLRPLPRRAVMRGAGGLALGALATGAVTLPAGVGAGTARALAQSDATPVPTASADAARQIAAEAYIYAYAMLFNYKTLYTQTQDPSFPGYIGGFNRYRHYSTVARPENTDIVSPNNDTPYSWAWLDLRTEPIVLSLPDVPADRYYVTQWFDLYTHNFVYLGTRATGNGAGDYLFTPPGWDGDVPDTITAVLPTETEFIGTLTRTEIKDEELENPAPMQAIQRQYRFRSLSEYAGTRPPFPAPDYLFPGWDEARAATPDFISYLNFLLQFCPAVPSEAEMMRRFAEIGIGPNVPFDLSSLPRDMQQALADGVADGLKQIEDTAIATPDASKLFGTRETLGPDYLMLRAVGAMLGIYGNTKEEAFYVGYQTEPDGQPLDGSAHYELRFAPGELPPAKYFWSMTLYNLPQRLLVDNPIDRYSIGSRTAGLKTEADGSLIIYLQPESPGADKESNWLPTPPDGDFYTYLRIYGPDASVLDGTWQAPEMERVS